MFLLRNFALPSFQDLGQNQKASTSNRPRNSDPELNETNKGRFILCHDGRSQLYNNDDTGKIISDDDSYLAALSEDETQGGGETQKIICQNDSDDGSQKVKSFVFKLFAVAAGVTLAHVN
jgi:hypothetical protein